MSFDRCNFKNSLIEMIGFKLYSSEGQYFYAWDYKHARKKKPVGDLFIINEYGFEVKCKS